MKFLVICRLIRQNSILIKILKLEEHCSTIDHTCIDLNEAELRIHLSAFPTRPFSESFFQYAVLIRPPSNSSQMHSSVIYSRVEDVAFKFIINKLQRTITNDTVGAVAAC